MSLLKRQRLLAAAKKIDDLLEWTVKGVSLIEKKLKNAVGKNGRKEKDNWWNNLMKKCQVVKDRVKFLS